MVKNLWGKTVKFAVWLLTYIFVHTYLRYKFNVVKEKGYDAFPKPPFIQVANHGTFFDPWLVLGYYASPKFFIMMNEDGFKSNKIVKWYLRVIGAFPKKKGVADYKAMKYTLKKLQEGFSILIFPEGQTTWDGETQPIYAGIEKIVKKANVSLVMLNLRGNFHSKPWWSETYRRGKVRVRIKTLRPDAVAAFSEQEILFTMKDFLYRNDIKDQENLKTTFTGNRLAEGLERFVWICRECLCTDTLVTQNSTVSCTNCRSSWSVDTHFRFQPENPQTALIGDLWDWASWHKKRVLDEVTAAGRDDLLTTSENAQYCAIDDFGVFAILATGTLTLTKTMLSFNPYDKKEHTLNFPVTDIHEYVFQRKDVFECRAGETVYHFRFIKHSPMKWVYYFRYLNGYEGFEKRGYI